MSIGWLAYSSYTDLRSDVSCISAFDPSGHCAREAHGGLEAEIDEQVDGNSHGNQLLEEEGLVLSCVVWCGGFPSRTVQDSILSFLAEAALQGVLGLPLREQRRCLLQLLPAVFYSCLTDQSSKRLHRLLGCFRFRFPIALRQITWERLCWQGSSTPAFADAVCRQALFGHKTSTAKAQTVPALPVIMRRTRSNTESNNSSLDNRFLLYLLHRRSQTTLIPKCESPIGTDCVCGWRPRLRRRSTEGTTYTRRLRRSHSVIACKNESLAQGSEEKHSKWTPSNTA